MNLYCDNNYNCGIFTNNVELISYDGGHLTKKGAKFLGEQLFDNENLKKFKIFEKFKY